MKAFALTTVDNPYDPFDRFDAWYNYDSNEGYHSCEYLARIARTSDQLSDEENNKEIERAIDEIIKLDLTKKYKKVEREMEEINSST